MKQIYKESEVKLSNSEMKKIKKVRTDGFKILLEEGNKQYGKALKELSENKKEKDLLEQIKKT